MSLASIATYTVGQCTAFVATALSWVPGGLGNANQWRDRARSLGYTISNQPVVGAVATFDAASSFGHVAAVKAINGPMMTIGEMNFTYGPNRYDERTIPISSSTGFILPPGTTPTTSSASGTSSVLGYPDWAHAMMGPMANLDPRDLVTRGVLIIFGLLVCVIGITILVGGQSIELVRDMK